MKNDLTKLSIRGLSFSSVALKLAAFVLLYLWKFEDMQTAGYIYLGYTWWFSLWWATLCFATDAVDPAPRRTLCLDAFHGACSIVMVTALMWLGEPVTAVVYLCGRLALSLVSARSISHYGLQR